MNNTIYIRKLKKLHNDNGDIFKFLQTGKNTKKISEIYFSEIKFHKIKCWKKHLDNNLRLHVIKGGIRFVIIKNKNFFKFDLNELTNQYIYIPKKTIFGFQGLQKKNLLICALEFNHNDREVINYNIEEFLYKNWK